MAKDEEFIAKTVAKAQKHVKRVEKRLSRASVKAERQAHILRMLEVAPQDPSKPKPGEDKPSGARMYMRAFRPQMTTKTADATNSAAIYELHMPDHGDAKVYGTTPKKTFTKAMKYMATYSKMLAEMFPGGEGAKKPDQGKPKTPNGKKPENDGDEKVRKAAEQLGSDTFTNRVTDGEFEFKGS